MSRMVLDSGWLEDAMIEFDTEDFNTICAAVIRNGLFNEKEKTGDGLIDTYIEDVLAESGRENAYKKIKLTSREMRGEIWKLAQTGMSGREIAKKLKVGKSTIFDNEGWKQRDNADYLDCLEEEKRKELEREDLEG